MDHTCAAANSRGRSTHREDLPRAEKLLRAAIALNPKRADAWHNLGYVLATTGRGPESEAAFGKAAELNASGR